MAYEEFKPIVSFVLRRFRYVNKGMGYLLELSILWECEDLRPSVFRSVELLRLYRLPASLSTLLRVLSLREACLPFLSSVARSVELLRLYRLPASLSTLLRVLSLREACLPLLSSVARLL